MAKVLDAGTRRLHGHAVSVRGSGAPVIVLAHGLGGMPHEWESVVERLTPHATVVTFAQAGSPAAGSDLFVWARHCSVLGYVDDLVRLLTDLDVGPVTFVGHSFAGAVGILAATIAPNLIDRMVLVNSSPRYLSDAETGYVGGFERSDVLRMRVAVASSQEPVAREYLRPMVGAASAPWTVEDQLAALEAYESEVSAAIASAVFTLDIREMVDRCVVPTLIVHSDDDPVVRESSVQSLQRMPRAEIRRTAVPGHYTHRHAPAETAESIIDFAIRRIA